MKCIFLISLLLSMIVLTISRPSDGIEIEKQRLIRFPDEHFHYQSPQQSDETRRILEEIKKINIALGYVKNPLNIRQHSQNILDPEMYLYPQSSYHPIYSNHKNALNISPTIRDLQFNQPIIARKIVHHHSLMLPEPISISDNYFYPVQHLRLPSVNPPKKFNNTIENASKTGDAVSMKSIFQQSPQNLMAISNDVTSIIEYVPEISETSENQIKQINNEEYKNLLLNSVKKIVEEAKTKKSNGGSEIHQYSRAANSRKPFKPIKIVLSPSQLKALTAMQNQIAMSQPKNANQFEKQDESNNKSKEKSPEKSEKSVEGSGKGPFGFLKPHVTPPPKFATVQHILGRPVKIKHQIATQNSQTDNKNQEDNDDDDDGENDKDDETLKGIFFGNRKEMIEAQKQALKEGGIVIQRLRVRKGGIAIAGPGGVATAGSGGTAIVGPGGVALTHPRSLTIAGPGAKIVALPKSHDLQSAILNAKGKDLPEEGRVVATGPAIYYHPENLENLHRLSEEDEEQQQNNNDGNIITLPYYGGAKGQVLQLINNPDGTVTTNIIKTDKAPDMPQKSPLERIQQAASKLINIQETAKSKGKFSSDDSKIYADNLYQLGIAAQELASAQSNGNQLKSLFEITPVSRFSPTAFEFDSENSDSLHNPINKEPDTIVQNDDEAIQVNAPNEDASVAEAKPVGLSIAGYGGVASSKPIGTAIVGPQGLAISRPVATAIAGLSQEDISNLGFQEISNKKQTASKLPLGSFSYKLGENGYLIGFNRKSNQKNQNSNSKTDNKNTSGLISSVNSPTIEKIENRKESKDQEDSIKNESENKKTSSVNIGVPGYLSGQKIPIEYFNYTGRYLHPSHFNFYPMNSNPYERTSGYSGVVFV